jgi:hypothetical protein
MKWDAVILLGTRLDGLRVMCGCWIEYVRLGCCMSSYISEDIGGTFFTDGMTSWCAGWVTWGVTAALLLHQETTLVLELTL